MSTITTHVLDTSLGCPANGMDVTLYRLEANGANVVIGRSQTDAEGRVKDWLPASSISSGTHRIEFDTAGYFGRSGRACFYPRVEVLFEVTADSEHYHVPLLLAPYGYTTYRGT